MKYFSEKLLQKYVDREQLNRFLDEVQAANNKFNLFSRSIGRNDLELLAAESLIPVDQQWIDEKSGSILDIGSGWGIPAVPILLSGLDINVTLVERSQKKADFLLLLFHRLGLKAEIFAGDLNNYHPDKNFGLVSLRGVAINHKIQRLFRQLILPGGSLIYFGSNFPDNWASSSQYLEYSIDNLPVRNLIKYTIF